MVKTLQVHQAAQHMSQRTASKDKTALVKLPTGNKSGYQLQKSDLGMSSIQFYNPGICALITLRVLQREVSCCQWDSIHTSKGFTDAVTSPREEGKQERSGSEGWNADMWKHSVLCSSAGKQKQPKPEMHRTDTRGQKDFLPASLHPSKTTSLLYNHT